MALRAIGLRAEPGWPRPSPASPTAELLACHSGSGRIGGACQAHGPGSGTAHRAMGRQKADPGPAHKNPGPGPGLARVLPGPGRAQANPGRALGRVKVLPIPYLEYLTLYLYPNG